MKTVVAQVDLATIDGLKKLIEIARSYFVNPESGFQIDIVVNNAGVCIPEALEGLTAEAYDGAFNSNARGPTLLVSAAIPNLPNDRSGRIVNIQSIGASMGLMYSTAHVGSKGTLEPMTRVWARGLAERATVNSVSVGPMAGTGSYYCMPKGMAQVVFPLLSNAPSSAMRPGADTEGVVEAAKDLGARSAHVDKSSGCCQHGLR